MAKEELLRECSEAVPPYWDRLNECTSETCHRPLPCPIHGEKNYTAPLSECPSCHSCEKSDRRWLFIERRICSDPWHGGQPMCPSCGSINPKYWNYSRAICPDPWHPFNRCEEMPLERVLAQRVFLASQTMASPSADGFEAVIREVLHDPRWEGSVK